MWLEMWSNAFRFWGQMRQGKTCHYFSSAEQNCGQSCSRHWKLSANVLLTILYVSISAKGQSTKILHLNVSNAVPSWRASRCVGFSTLWEVIQESTGLHSTVNGCLLAKETDSRDIVYNCNNDKHNSNNCLCCCQLHVHVHCTYECLQLEVTF